MPVLQVVGWMDGWLDWWLGGLISWLLLLLLLQLLLLAHSQLLLCSQQPQQKPLNQFLFQFQFQYKKQKKNKNEKRKKIPTVYNFCYNSARAAERRIGARNSVIVFIFFLFFFLALMLLAAKQLNLAAAHAWMISEVRDIAAIGRCRRGLDKKIEN